MWVWMIDQSCLPSSSIESDTAMYSRAVCQSFQSIKLNGVDDNRNRRAVKTQEGDDD